MCVLIFQAFQVWGWFS